MIVIMSNPFIFHVSLRSPLVQGMQVRWEEARHHDTTTTQTMLDKLYAGQEALLNVQAGAKRSMDAGLASLNLGQGEMLDLLKLLIAESKSASRRSKGSISEGSVGDAPELALPWLHKKDIKKNKVFDDPDDPEDYEFEQLGDGAQGAVFKGKYRGDDVAIKVMDVHESQMFAREVSILSRLGHPNVCKFYGAYMGKKNGEIVLELLSKSLYDAIYKNDAAPLSSEQKLLICIGIADGMKYLHGERPKVVHRDLKPHNVCLTDTLKAKIVDFGLAVTKTSSQMYESKLHAAGTLYYMAPEFMVDERGGNHKVDNFAFGITIWELYAEEEPFAGIADLAIGRMVEKNKRPPIEAVKEKDIKQLIKACWHQKPGKRPEMADVVGVIECAMSTALVEAESGGGGSATKKGRGWFRPVSGEHYMDALIEDVDSEDELDV